eukprot:GHVS01107854.1.p1 GENE.GHVS01107854.1~~GHVS01107854.1.p1  ORF type:complete len:276 (-),score=42.27 GHVS01107854.1:268-1095(-)
MKDCCSSYGSATTAVVVMMLFVIMFGYLRGYISCHHNATTCCTPTASCFLLAVHFTPSRRPVNSAASFHPLSFSSCSSCSSVILFGGPKNLIDWNDPIDKRRGYRKVLKNKPIHRIYNRSIPYLRTLERSQIDQMVVDVRHEQWMNTIRLNGRHEDYSKIYERDLRDLLSKLYLVATEKFMGLNMPKATPESVEQEEERIRLVANSEQTGKARESNGGSGNHFGRSGFIGGKGVSSEFGPGPTGYNVDVREVEENRKRELGEQWFYGGNGKRHFN